MGGNKYTKPSAPAYAPEERDLNSFQSFDRSGLVNQLINSMQASVGPQQAKALARASKLGTGRSSGTVGQLENIAADTENRIGQAKGQAALESWNDRMKQKQMADQFAMQKYQADLDRYKYDAGVYEAGKRDKILGIF